ncbi:MAG: hypothetical protein JNK05_25570 [Myxococcales bacterium]|nr:hypothetical protein [Myxococcales bacterium]
MHRKSPSMEPLVDDLEIDRRLRNRIIEYLELVASFEFQREYQRIAPVWVPNEVINQWEDRVGSPACLTFAASPVYTLDEDRALRDFHEVWLEVADGTPDPLPELEETLRLPAWERLRAAAESALRVMMVQGYLPEHH